MGSEPASSLLQPTSPEETGGNKAGQDGSGQTLVACAETHDLDPTVAGIAVQGTEA